MSSSAAAVRRYSLEDPAEMLAAPGSQILDSNRDAPGFPIRDTDLQGEAAFRLSAFAGMTSGGYNAPVSGTGGRF